MEKNKSNKIFTRIVEAFHAVEFYSLFVIAIIELIKN